MSKLTEFLKLFKHDVQLDGEEPFDIEKALNENWEKIDKSCKDLTNNKSDKESVASKIQISLDPKTYLITLKLFNFNDTMIDSKDIDLNLKSFYTDANYDNDTKELVLITQDGDINKVSIAELINDLTSTEDLNKLEKEFNGLLNNKVDKEDGKSLTDVNFSQMDKNKLDTLNNYDDSKINSDIKNIEEKLEGKVDKEEGKCLSDVNFSAQDKEKLDNLKNYDDTALKKEVSENTTARHTHANKEILDKTTASYTSEKDEMITQHEKDLANLLSKSTDIEKAIENYFSLTPDNGIYTVRFPKWSVSHSCQGEKLDDNKDKFLNLATDTIKEETNYGQAFETYDCNAYVDDDGVRHVTALKGMKEYKDVGKVNVFVLGRTYWQKWWADDEWVYYSRTFVKRPGYKVCKMSINKDGSISPYWLIAKYVAGDIPSDNGDHMLYSSKGLIPAHYINKVEGEEELSDTVSYNACISLFKKNGKYYSGGTAAEYMHILTTIWLKFATKNSQSVLAGNTINSYQYQISKAEENTNRVILKKAQANNIDIDSYVSVGDVGENTSHDRSYGYMHNLAYNVRVVSKEEIDEENTALILEHDNFNTTETTWVSTMHERSGYSDKILGRNGSIISNTNGKHGAVLDGIECFVGGYEVFGNAIVDINGETTNREIYITNDATKLTSTVATIRSTYNKCENVIPCTQALWKYITNVELDLDNGIAIPTSAGEEGSGTSTGCADALYTDNSTSGQRELLLLGYLTCGASAGASCCNLYHALSTGAWFILARPSINLLGGELVED